MDSVTGVFLSVFETPFYGCFHCVKSVQYRAFSGPYFHVFELTTERYSISPVFSPNTAKYGPEKIPYLATFYAVFLTLNINVFL